MRRRLEWELRYRRDHHSIESGIAKGRPFPPWFLDRPPLRRFECAYMEAFWNLDTERQAGNMTLGRIPWSKAREYARVELGLVDELLSLFWKIIKAMDDGFLKYQKDEHDRTARSQARARAR